MKKNIFFLSLFISSCLYLKAQDSLQQYTARYKFAQGALITEVDVVLDNGILQVNSSMGNALLEKTSADQFTIPLYNGTVVFIRNEAKKIIGIKIDVMNINLEGIREEKENSIINMPAQIYKTTFPIKYLPAMLGEEFED
jgi:hypothetical protein